MFADAEIPSGIGYVLATVLGGVFAKLFDMLGARDKLRYDARLSELEHGVKECQQKHSQCEESHAESLAEIANLRAEMRERDERDKAEMRAEIAELRREQQKNPTI